MIRGFLEFTLMVVGILALGHAILGFFIGAPWWALIFITPLGVAAVIIYWMSIKGRIKKNTKGRVLGIILMVVGILGLGLAGSAGFFGGVLWTVISRTLSGFIAMIIGWMFIFPYTGGVRKDAKG